MGTISTANITANDITYNYTFFSKWMSNTSTYQWTSSLYNNYKRFSGKIFNWSFVKVNATLGQGAYQYNCAQGFIQSTTDIQKSLPLLEFNDYSLPALKTASLLTSAEAAQIPVVFNLGYDHIYCTIENTINQNKWMFITNGNSSIIAYSKLVLDYIATNSFLTINGVQRQGNLYSIPNMEIEYQYSSYSSSNGVYVAPRWRGFNTIGGHSNNNTGKIVDVDIYRYSGTEGEANWYGYCFDSNNRTSQQILMSNSIIYSSYVNENTYYVQSDEHYHSVLLNFANSSTYYTFLNTYVTNMTSYNSTLIKFYNLTPTLTEHSQRLWNPWVSMSGSGIGSSAVGAGIACGKRTRLHDNIEVNAPYSKIRLKKWAININKDWPIYIDYDHMPSGSGGVYGYSTTDWEETTSANVYSDTTVRITINGTTISRSTGYTSGSGNTVKFATSNGVYGLYRVVVPGFYYHLIEQTPTSVTKFEIRQESYTNYFTLSGINTPYAEFNSKFRDNWSDRVICWAKGQNTIINGDSSIDVVDDYKLFREGVYYLTLVFTVEFLDSNNNVLHSRDTTFVQTYTQTIDSDSYYHLKPRKASPLDLFA